MQPRSSSIPRPSITSSMIIYIIISFLKKFASKRFVNMEISVRFFVFGVEPSPYDFTIPRFHYNLSL